MLEPLNWKQTNKNVFVTVKFDKKSIKFKLDDRIIFHLIGNSPKIYFFTVNIGDKKLDFLADFSALKPIIKSSGKLSFKIKSSSKSEVSEVSTFGNYVIARGESFHERFLGVKGWQPQEYLFNIIPLEQKNIQTIPHATEQSPTLPETEIKSTKIIKQTTQPTETISHKEEKSKFQECPKCGNVVTSDFDTCPHCFNSILVPEKDVDFAL